LATGAIGDAYAEDNKPEEALKNYVKAAGINKNDFTTPLLKAGKTALALGKKKMLLNISQTLKTIDASPEAASVDV
jgi:hypothetical protein